MVLGTPTVYSYRRGAVRLALIVLSCDIKNLLYKCTKVVHVESVCTTLLHDTLRRDSSGSRDRRGSATSISKSVGSRRAGERCRDSAGLLLSVTYTAGHDGRLRHASHTTPPYQNQYFLLTPPHHHGHQRG
jgi:hypothetical protein